MGASVSTVTVEQKNRLPEEIWVKVFGSADDLVTVTHVCRTWRIIALQSPLLWSYINLGSGRCPSRLDIFLSRSKSLPLSVYIDFTKCQSQRGFLDSLLSVFCHMDRIRSLRILSVGKTLPEECASLIESTLSTREAPMLESLEIDITNFYWSFKMQDTPRPLPSLRNIYITNFFFPWRCSILRDLTRLLINATCLNLADFIKLSDLIEILKACPGLQMLYVGSNGLLDTEELIDVVADKARQESAIGLPLLTNITLSNIPIQFCHRLAVSIKPCKQANWHIKSLYPVSFESCSSISALLKLAILHSDGRRRRTMKCIIGDQSLSIYTLPFGYGQHCAGELGHIYLDLKFWSSLGHYDATRTLSTIFEAMNVQMDVACFVVGFEETQVPRSSRFHSFCKAVFWEELKRALNTVQHLSIKLTSEFSYDQNSDDIYTEKLVLWGIVSALKIYHDSSGASSPGKSADPFPICPHLTSLEIIHANSAVCGDILYCLKKRSECKRRLQSLRLSWPREVVPLPHSWLLEAQRHVDGLCVEATNGSFKYGKTIDSYTSLDFKPVNFGVEPSPWHWQWA